MLKSVKGYYEVVMLLVLQIIFAGNNAMSQIKNENNNTTKGLTITVVYDNNPMVEGLKTDWGFACFIEMGKTKLLFDTGDNGDILLNNMAKLGIDPKTIDLVFLSHFHHDHTGGLKDFLMENPNVVICYPQSFPSQLTEMMKSSGAIPVPISSFQKLQPDIFSLGELGESIPEQSLAIRTSKGIVVITGCAHPGIIAILEKAKSSFPGETIYLTMGGFHLHRLTEDEIRSTINALVKLEIRTVGSSHCSGDAARKMFKEVYNGNYIQIGTGKVVTIK